MKKVYTEEHKAFFASFIPGHTTTEVVAEFNRRFEQKTTASKVKSYKTNNRIKKTIVSKAEHAKVILRAKVNCFHGKSVISSGRIIRGKQHCR